MALAPETTLPAGAPVSTAMPLRWLPLWVLAAGLVLTAALGAWSFQREAAQNRVLLTTEARELSVALQRQVQGYLDTLPGLRVYGVLQEAPNDAEFLRYVEAISLQERYPGLAVAFIAERVAHTTRPAFEARARADRSVQARGHPGFAIKPEGRRPEYMVLRHLYPEDPPAFGYDLFDPSQNYRGAVETAIDTGQYVATPPLQLARDRDRPVDPGLTSIVVRAALYRGGATPADQTARRQQAIGVVGIGFRIPPLMSSVMTPRALQAFRVRVVDDRAAAAGTRALLFDSAAGTSAGAAPLPPAFWAGRITVADRVWTLSAYPQSALSGQDSTWVLVFFGAGLSLVLAALTQALVQKNLGTDARLREAAAALRVERDQLQLSEARFRMLFEHSFDAVLRTRPDGSVLAANAAACKMFGASEQALRALGRGGLIDPADERLALMLSERSLSGRAAGGLRMRRADGSTFEAEISSSIYLDGEGVETTSVIVRDVTEQQRLAQRLQERQRLEAIGTLAGGVAHDFNNMLAAILGNVSLAEAEIAADSPARARLQLVHRAAQRARSLVRQILTFSRRAPREAAIQELQPLVDDSAALLRSTLPPSVRLTVQPSDVALWTRVDAAQVQQVVINLCTNAWQALPQQTGEVQIWLEPQDLSATAADSLGVAAGPFAALHVKDTGVGMDASVRARIFEPFFTTKPAGEGTGLGLAVVHGVVSASGGAIHVESKPGAGTHVTIYLPLTLPPVAPEARAEALPERPLNTPAPGRVLYVDDDEVVALTAQALFSRAGFEVDLFSDGASAVHAVELDPDRYAVLVTDFNMPGMSGLTVAEQALRAAPGMRVVLITGHITEELRVRARTLGVSEVLRKENMLESLVAAVSRACTPQG